MNSLSSKKEPEKPQDESTSKSSDTRNPNSQDDVFVDDKSVLPEEHALFILGARKPEPPVR